MYGSLFPPPEHSLPKDIYIHRRPFVSIIASRSDSDFAQSRMVWSLRQQQFFFKEIKSYDRERYKKDIEEQGRDRIEIEKNRPGDFYKKEPGTQKKSQPKISKKGNFGRLLTVTTYYLPVIHHTWYSIIFICLFWGFVKVLFSFPQPIGFQKTSKRFFTGGL
jgi:hypothetical protein